MGSKSLQLVLQTLKKGQDMGRELDEETWAAMQLCESPAQRAGESLSRSSPLENHTL